VGWLLLGFGLCLCAAGLTLAWTNYGVAQGQAAALVAGYVPATIVRARGIERQQLRWVALATVLIALFAALDLAALALGVYWLAPVVGGLNPPLLSAAIGAAILRYRLYDLDRIISRTWPWPHWSSRPGAASSRPWTAGSAGVATTPCR
jgi:hypothetical protein